MALIKSTATIPSGATYELEQSLKFNDDDDSYLSFTPASAGNRRTWTFSAWVKKGNITNSSIFACNGGGSDALYTRLAFHDNASIIVTGNNTVWKLTDGTQAFRDPSAWYHIVLVLNTPSSTAADRMILYVNGTRLTAFSHDNNPDQNEELGINNTNQHHLGSAGNNNSPTVELDGYLSEVNFIDGSAKAPADFGETGDYGEWKPIEYSGSYGTNGFYLPFKNDYTVEGFSTVLYKGTNANQYIGGTGFKPNLTWLKRRDSSAGHMLYDSIRGVGKSLSAQSTGAENVSDGGDDLTAFNTDGFSLGPVHQGNSTNVSGGSIVAWNWDMGADTPTGFGCVTYTGNGGIQNVSGFNFSPDLIWFKRRSTACLLYTSPSPRDQRGSRMPSSA